MTAATFPLGRRIRYALETVFVYAVYSFFRLLPLDSASDFGGWICRRIGPRLKSSATARRNLAAAFPEKSEEERESIVRGMWDNLGRVAAEYAHLHRIWNRVDLAGGEYLEDVRRRGQAAIFFTGHIANWEIPAIAAKKAGVNISLVYRKPNNPGVDGLLRHARSSGAAGHIKKGGEGARDMVAVLKNNGVLGVLMDQKLNEGMPIPFFGRDAMTAPAIAHFSFKFNCPVYPVRIERLPQAGAKFRMTIFPPLALPRSGDKERDTRVLLTEINRLLESWIRERPEQWLWIHRRWPDKDSVDIS